MRTPCWSLRAAVVGSASALALVAGPFCAAQEPELTGLQVQGDSVRITWGSGLDRYIIERFDPGQAGSTAVGTSSGLVESAATVPAEADSLAFFRLRSGLQAVRLADAPLETAVRASVGTAKTGPTNWLYDADVRGLTNLSVAMRGVSSLEGVAGLEDLAWFDVGGNRIDTLAGLAACQDLQVLRVDGNNLGSLDGVGALSGLQVLDVSHNVIADLAPVGALASLEAFYADHNQIASLAPLAGLTGLRLLDLSNNLITDLAPLLQNAQQGGLGAGDVVYLSGNPIASTGTVAALRGFGVTVVFP